MGYFYFLLGVAAILVLSMLLSLRKSLKRQFALPYVADRTFFTPEQRAFVSVLERALGTDYRVCAKVRVADVVGLRGRLSRDDQERAYQRLGERRFDFLVCAADTSAIVCAVNLAPRSRRGKPPPKDILDRICAAAGLPFVRIRERDAYALDEVAAIVSDVMQHRKASERDAVLPHAEAEAMLQGLSKSILGEERGARPARAPESPRRREPEVGVSKRRDPLILGREDIEDGPSFTIQDDLDEVSPRPGRRR
ncbi:hypothetical protein ThidrDRAFT_0870 [Thiorhodococcus drewsii AZ1]|uniref:DUF2726 domain-containing protein n=1 Tax=Thiorhodococcus drewsii AZ1 TaxID=765913 RepID=G2DXG0_9GAMM|nr:DUF2726 domain-containing protein [Thiorhodococcus drewsii]EGV33192.1 hypothetical protein ThidrDRAFT_0870 [Thiorhodococcus drewsii AZ1]